MDVGRSQRPKTSTAVGNGMNVESGYVSTSSRVSSVDNNGLDINGKHDCESEDNSSVENGSSSVDKSWFDMDSQHDCLNPNFPSIEKFEVDVDGDDDKGESPKFSAMKEMDIDGKHEYQSPEIPSVDTSESSHSVKDKSNIYVVPELGTEFESEDHAYKCYNRYAAMKGFSIRKDFVNKSRINGLVISRRYTCYKQGYRPSKNDANVKKPRMNTRTGCLAHMTIARQTNGKYRVTHFEPKHNHEFATPCKAHLLPSQRRVTFAEAVEAESGINSETDGMPKLGMGFDSEDRAYEFYNSYAGRIGFSVRKDYVNRSKVDGGVASRRFTCFREGFRQKDKRDLNVKRPRKETRIGCLAQLVIARQQDGKYRVTHFEENHNHELVPAYRVRMLRSQKRSTAIQSVDASGLKSASEFICASVGNLENSGYQPIDHRSSLPSKRMRDMRQGEAESIVQYLNSKQLKDLSFSYAVQVDSDEQLTNVFWADAKMMDDYGDFGDVVCLDMTFSVNDDFRPFTPFVGVNHHKQMVIFGAALLYDETVESFKWLFRTFLEAMSGKKPKSLLTDRHLEMAKAISLELPETVHQLCVWHVYQNALKHIRHAILSSNPLAGDLSTCLFNYEEEEDFINRWKIMLDAYCLWQNECLGEIFKEREKWALPYCRHVFSGDINGVLLSESFIINLRKHLKPELDVLQFFKHVGKLVNDWRYKELEANYDMRQNTPRLMGDVIMLKHARDVYTPKIFELFQQEYENSLNAVVNQCAETGPVSEYKVSMYGELREYTVMYNLEENSVFCKCMKFQSVGILCSHALKVLDYRNVKVVPAQYILKRWTKDARV